MTFSEGPTNSEFNIEGAKDDPDFPFPIMAQKTQEDLANLHGRARGDYETWKRDLLNWLYHEGKNPGKAEGFAMATIRKTSYHVDQIMRWVWKQRDYTTDLTPDDADDLMRTLGRHSSYEDSNLNNIIKAFKRIFKYYNIEKGKNIEWSCNYSTSEEKVTNRDYFKKDEFRPLYEASLRHGAVKHYNQCTVEERDNLKAHLSQRFDKPKAQVTKDDFQRANSFKIPSLVATTLDMGLRPIEINRATAHWIDLDNQVLKIPADESSKNRDNWECVLSNNSVRCLRKWISERSSYQKYDNTNSLWLNRQGNPYTSRTLNPLLDKLIEEAGIEPAGRDLTWYSIRHGVATMWANEEDIHNAKEQLRHKRVKTTMGYAHSSPSERHKGVNSKY